MKHRLIGTRMNKACSRLASWSMYNLLLDTWLTAPPTWSHRTSSSSSRLHHDVVTHWDRTRRHAEVRVLCCTISSKPPTASDAMILTMVDERLRTFIKNNSLFRAHSATRSYPSRRKVECSCSWFRHTARTDSATRQLVDDHHSM